MCAATCRRFQEQEKAVESAIATRQPGVPVVRSARYGHTSADAHKSTGPQFLPPDRADSHAHQPAGGAAAVSASVGHFIRVQIRQRIQDKPQNPRERHQPSAVRKRRKRRQRQAREPSDGGHRLAERFVAQKSQKAQLGGRIQRLLLKRKKNRRASAPPSGGRKNY